MTAAPEASTALYLLDGAGPGQGAPSPRRLRPRPRPPPPRAARSVPAARLGRSGPPLSSARSCSGRRAPAAAAAARADGGPGVPAVAAALLRSVELRLWL
ncbi:forkhead box protein D1-like [Apodemus sylvaticus]|uniref:forkhead box protein D1-like n=1 Tax=Apodemus sylvaticus TaxID=10129 RepID=UPI0022437347|nr:forkhead box protein D1-like [Apodemus sylvaticus]